MAYFKNVCKLVKVRLLILQIILTPICLSKFSKMTIYYYFCHVISYRKGIFGRMEEVFKLNFR